MKPAWDQLMKQYETSDDILIADVDCTADGEQLCSDHEIEGYPTLKFGAPDALKDYDGGNEFGDLLQFAKTNLGPCCGPENLELCNDGDKAMIEAIIATGVEKLEEEIDEFHKVSESMEEEFYAKVDVLQETYDKLMEERDKVVKGARGDDLMLLEKVSAYLEEKEVEEVKQELKEEEEEVKQEL